MSIKQLDHDDGIRILIKLLYEGKLTPIIGSGFTMGCQSKKANVPDGKKATEIMQRIIKKIRPMNLSKADFNKTSERFFSVVSKEQQWKFFEEYFTDVKVNGYLYDFLALPWTYVYKPLIHFAFFWSVLLPFCGFVYLGCDSVTRQDFPRMLKMESSACRQIPCKLPCGDTCRAGETASLSSWKRTRSEPESIL